MATFDAPSREVCVSRRIRTNTPLQALVTLNEPAFVEAAQALARRVIAKQGHDASRDQAALTMAMRLVVARTPSNAELAELAALLSKSRGSFAAGGAENARKAAGADETMKAEDAAELAAWTTVCGVVLNLDEALTKE